MRGFQDQPFVYLLYQVEGKRVAGREKKDQLRGAVQMEAKTKRGKGLTTQRRRIEYMW